MPKEIQEYKIPDLEEVSKLLLDAKNYRLPKEEIHKADQVELLKILERDFDLNTIAESMIDNGYFAEEPLIVIPGPSDNFIVVEGNRRLATLKFLIQKDCRSVSYQQKYWENASKRLKYNLSKVPVIKYSNRQDLTRFLGFRHIAGILKWDPLSKARFIDALVEQRDKDVDFAEIARETGSRKSTIRDNYIAYRILLQAKENFEIDTSKLEKNFGVFYRSLGTPAIANFIGLKKDLPSKKLKNPIPPKKVSALEELIGYIHGIENILPVITDSRQLTDLGEILESKDAHDSLRRYRVFDLAFQLSGGEERRLIENLKKATHYLKEALRDTYQYKYSKEVEDLMNLFWATALEIIRHFPKVQGKAEE